MRAFIFRPKKCHGPDSSLSRLCTVLVPIIDRRRFTHCSAERRRQSLVEVLVLLKFWSYSRGGVGGLSLNLWINVLDWDRDPFFGGHCVCLQCGVCRT